MESSSLQELEQIPGVGKTIARDMQNIGTAASVALCAAAGVSIVRVHDVAEMVDVVKVVNFIR